MTRAIAAVIVLAALAGCGGGGGTTLAATQVVAAPTNNVATITIDGGPANIANIPFVTVTVCAPGSTTACQTISHIEIDTGSSGLRILSSVLNSTLVLPQANSTSGNALLECTEFADGFSWGPVKTADVEIGGETATSIPVQIIGDPTYTTIPGDCSSSGTEEDTVDTFGANGILGVGLFVQDCGAACASSAVAGTYYGCSTASSCRSAAAATAQQVANPVAHFAADNNGVIVELPAVGANGSASPTGSLVFGIGTQTNNALGTAQVYTVDSTTGNLTVTYKNARYTDSFIDSGSNANYFVDNSIATCPSNSQSAPGFFCPASTLSLSAILMGENAVQTTIDFSVANAQNLITGNTASTAFSSLAAPETDHTSFDLGLPFFFGHNVYTVLEDANTTGGVGPFFAF